MHCQMTKLIWVSSQFEWRKKLFSQKKMFTPNLTFQNTHAWVNSRWIWHPLELTHAWVFLEVRLGATSVVGRRAFFFEWPCSSIYGPEFLEVNYYNNTEESKWRWLLLFAKAYEWDGVYNVLRSWINFREFLGQFERTTIRVFWILNPTI